MNKLPSLGALAVSILLVMIGATTSPAVQAKVTRSYCQRIAGGTKTAKIVDPIGTISGMVDASGCDYGIYFDSNEQDSIENATIINATIDGIEIQSDANILISDSTIATQYNGSDKYPVGIDMFGSAAKHGANVTISNSAIIAQGNGINFSGGNLKIDHSSITSYLGGGSFGVFLDYAYSASSSVVSITSSSIRGSYCGLYIYGDKDMASNSSLTLSDVSIFGGTESITDTSTKQSYSDISIIVSDALDSDIISFYAQNASNIGTFLRGDTLIYGQILIVFSATGYGYPTSASISVTALYRHRAPFVKAKIRAALPAKHHISDGPCHAVDGGSHLAHRSPAKLVEKTFQPAQEGERAGRHHKTARLVNRA